MTLMTVTEDIEADCETVFSYATDVPNWPDYITGIVGTEILDEEPMRLGTRFRETRVMFGKEATEEMEFVEFDSPRRYVVESVSCGAVFRSECCCEARDENRCKISISVSSRPLTMVSRVLSFVTRPLMKWTMRKCLVGDLRDLKKSIESRCAIKNSPKE